MNKIILGGVVIILLAAGSIWAAEYPVNYECECVDTGLECEAISQMQVIVRSRASVKFRLTDNEGRVFASFESLRDVAQRSKGKNGFKRFYHNNKKFTKPYPHLFVEDDLLSAQKSGEVKMPEYLNGELAHTWEYECAKLK